MQLRPLSRRPTAAAAAPTEDAAAAESEAGVAIDSPTSLRAFMQALQSKADELRTLANSLSPTDSAQVDDAHSAVQRLRAFVAIGHQLSEEYVNLLGTQPGGSQGGVPRALASHVVRAEVLLGSVTATRRAFECAEVPLGTELVELQVRGPGPLSPRRRRRPAASRRRLRPARVRPRAAQAPASPPASAHALVQHTQ